MLYALQRRAEQRREGVGRGQGAPRPLAAPPHLKLSRLFRSVPSAMQRAEWHSASWLPGPTIHAFWDANAEALFMNLPWGGGGTVGTRMWENMWGATSPGDRRTR